MKTVKPASATHFLKSVFVILICLIGQITEAQITCTVFHSNGKCWLEQVKPQDTIPRFIPPYAKLFKGEPNPFDTAVAIRIDRYRMEGLKLKYGQQLVDSLLAEINSLRWETKLCDSINSIQNTIIVTLVTANARKDSVNHLLNTNFDKLYGIAEAQNKWYKRPEYVVGAFVVVELLRFAATLIKN